MHKITKGLKKKKKGKKSKHKEEELFKPEELEAYKRAHQHQQQPNESSGGEQAAGVSVSGGGGEKPAATAGENEEWRKFLVLTSGVDDILKKTQGDLDRIKSTSFFQRVPPPSEIKKREDEIRQAEEKEQQQVRALQEQIAKVEAAIVEVSESESEEDDEDDIFDTAYIDAIASGEVKLAYIPDSPTEPEDGDDPFDTSIADKAILGPQTERRGKKLVPLGSAVDILTGRVQAPICAAIKRPSPKRQIISQQQNLLGSFDNTTADVYKGLAPATNEPNPLSLLDEDASDELSKGEIDLSKSIVINQKVPELASVKVDTVTDLVEEFDEIANPPEDEDDLEFAQLAAESLTKAPINAITVLPQEPILPEKKEDWNAKFEKQEGDVSEEEVDPFDTTFAENILPGQAELRIIENEILNADDFEFNPRANEKYNEIIKSAVTIQLTNPGGERESISSIDRVNEEALSSIKPIHRDLLGGSSTDLSQLAEQPLKPNEQSEEDTIEYSDPFDTSIVDVAALPGQTELKFLEQELLADVTNNIVIPILTDDDDFDPRQGEEPRKTETATSIQARKVSFDLPLSKSDLLSLDSDEQSRVSKPLTPYYVRENSIQEDFVDPFDTAFVGSIGPGKAELKLLEEELINKDLKQSISDNDFNPRDERQVNVAKVVQAIHNLTDPTLPAKPIDLVFEEAKVDLLSVTEDINTKVLTPQDTTQEPDDIDIDPFDTSIASNILPGQTELKLLETELKQYNPQIKRVLTDPDFDPRNCTEEAVAVQQPADLLEPTNDFVFAKPLTPITGTVSFSIGEDDDIDPFDTSIANNIAPGPGELKIIESELT